MKNDIVIAVSVAGAFFFAMLILFRAPKFRFAFLVSEGYTCLLFHKGKFAEALGAGRYVRWGRHYAFTLLDHRKTSLLVASQEILTSDNVGVKISLLITYQIVDAVKAALETQSWRDDIYNAAQIALRSVANGVAAEALLAQRFDIGAQLLARVQPEAAKFGVNVLAVEVKDVMFGADLKRAFADVLRAKQEGQAALERARGEGAALRSLANAARVLEGNPALMNLRLMQSISAAQNAGNTLVLGMPGGFVPLKNGKAAPAGETKENGGAES